MNCQEEIIKYFRKSLRKKLDRPCCGKYLSLWDDKKWKKHITNIDVEYINSNDFLIFLYQTKYDLCCISSPTGQILYNALNRFFYIIFEFETYFNVFILNKIYKDRIEIINDIIVTNTLK